MCLSFLSLINRNVQAAAPIITIQSNAQLRLPVVLPSNQIKTPTTHAVLQQPKLIMEILFLTAIIVKSDWQAK